MKIPSVLMAALSLFCLTAGVASHSTLVSSAPAVGGRTLSQKLPVPDRRFISAEPAETWEQGLLSCNGMIGASVLSRPLDEIVVFDHGCS